MNKFYIVTNRTKDPELETTNYICDYLKERGGAVTVLARENAPKYTGKESGEYNPLHIPEDTDCVLVLGGDGTLLQTARDTMQLSVPLLWPRWKRQGLRKHLSICSVMSMRRKNV
jgi:NAD+ kinase